MGKIKKMHKFRYLTVTATIFFGELFLKNHVEKTEVEGETRTICHGKLLLRKYHNEGAFLDMGEKKSKVVASLSLTLTLLATIIFITTFTNKGSVFLKWGLTLLLGGAYSNTYDRLVRGYVVDYVSFPVKNKKIRGIVFNISDFCIMIGAALMVLSEYHSCP